MGLKHASGIETGIDTHRFRELSLFVSKASHRTLPAWKAVVGERVFAHESGLHTDGVLKDPKNYEGFDPAEVGLTRQIIVGKHSGSKAILLKFDEYGIDLTQEQANAMLPLVRTMSIELKRSLYDKELLYIYKDYMKAAGAPGK